MPCSQNDPSASILAEGGLTEWLVLGEVGDADGDGIRRGRYRWKQGAEGEAEARASQSTYYAKSEGIDYRPLGCSGSGASERCIGRVYFTAKSEKKLVILHTDSTSPDEGEVHISSTVSGAFNRQPDQAILGKMQSLNHTMSHLNHQPHFQENHIQCNH